MYDDLRLFNAIENVSSRTLPYCCSSLQTNRHEAVYRYFESTRDVRIPISKIYIYIYGSLQRHMRTGGQDLLAVFTSVPSLPFSRKTPNTYLQFPTELSGCNHINT